MLVWEQNHNWLADVRMEGTLSYHGYYEDGVRRKRFLIVMTKDAVLSALVPHHGKAHTQIFNHQ